VDERAPSTGVSLSQSRHTPTVVSQKSKIWPFKGRPVFIQESHDGVLRMMLAYSPTVDRSLT